MQGESHPDPWKYEIPENKINMKLSEITGSAFKKVPKGRSSWADPDSVKNYFGYKTPRFLGTFNPDQKPAGRRYAPPIYRFTYWPIQYRTIML
ncbi:hypothetical protein M8J76_008122 [Diaphorina citri]|nr:hypothetical protein M8J76_008122 [Diaphorina citri]